jgi:hypothetical protein
MKNINHFLSEADAKEKGVKSDADKTKEMKAHHAKELEALNDKMYVALMDQYKQARRHDRKAAGKLLEKAQKLKNVSHRAKLGAAYL